MKKLYLCIWLFTSTLFLKVYAQQPVSNWRLIPSSISDSQANTTLVNNLSSGTPTLSELTIAANSSRTLVMKLPAVSVGGMMTFAPVVNATGLTVNTFQSTDGKKWVSLSQKNFPANETGNLQKADIIPSSNSQWFKVEFVNTSTTEAKVSSVGLYNFKTSATSKNPYFLLFGASITVSSGGNAEWLATLKARVGNYDAVFFNLAVSGDNTSALYSKVDGFLAQHPNAGYVLLEIGGNDVSAQRVMTFADYKGSYIQTMDFQIRDIIKKITTAGKDFALSRISYRNYPDKTNFQGKFQPSVNNGLNQENGSLPYNFIIDKIIKETNPVFWNETERRGVIDFYQYTLNNQQWLVAGDGVHFYGTEAFHIRDFWADYALKYFFTGQRSAVVPYTEYITNLTTKATQAVVTAESVRTEESVFNARILVEQLNSTATRIPLLNRLDAILGQNTTPPVTFTASQTNIAGCFGDATGSITVTASGGTTPYQFSINNGNFVSNNGIFTNLTAGNYTITIKDNAGKTATVPTITISQPSQLAATAVKTDVNCNGNNGSVTLTVSGGTSPYQFSVNNGSFIAGSGVFQNLTTGNYTIRVKDAKGCIVSVPTLTLVQLPAPVISVSNKKDVSCAGGNDGGFIINVSGGTASYQFAVNTNTFTTQSNNFTTLSAGIYNVSVKDGNGCIVSVPAFEIKEPTPVGVVVTGKTDIACAGDKSGSFTVSASGGTSPYTFSVNGGAFDNKNTFSNLAAGSYTFSVKDSKGCLANGNTTILSNTPLAITLAGSSSISCSGGNDGSFAVNVSGGTAPYLFSVNGGTFFAGDGKFNNLTADSYSIVVKDAKGCIQSLPAVTLTEPEPINIVLQSKTSIKCNGGNDGQLVIRVSGGTPAYRYFINEKEVAAENGTFAGLVAGNYKITIKDAKNCSQSLETNITEPPKLSLNLQSKTAISCNGKSDGQIIVAFSGGVAPYLFSVNGGTFTSGDGNFTNLPAGSYTITIKDSQECIYNISGITLTEPVPLSLTLSGKTDITCVGSTNGQISVNATGGTLPYRFIIDNQTESNGTFTNLAAGKHIITITDSKGCSQQTEVVLSEPQPVSLTLRSKTDVTCFAGSNGIITTDVSGGNQPYHYFINNQEITAGNGTFSNLPAGLYTIFVKDANGCSSASVSVAVSQPASPLTLTLVSKTDISCFGSNDGKITIQASGGSSGYQYFIDNLPTANITGSFTQLSARKHTIAVQDEKKCLQTLDVTITEAPELLIKIKEIIHPASTGKFGQISVTAEGGHGNFEFSLNGGSFLKNDGVFKALLAGMYKITVKDGQGCMVSTAHIVLSGTGVPAPSVSIFPNPTTTGVIKVTLFTTDFLTSCLVQINDLSGKMLYEKAVPPGVLVNGLVVPENVSLQTGIYILTIKQGTTILTTRFVVE